MALRCDNCNKGVMYGHNVSHAKNRTAKAFKPNLHSVRLTIGGTSKKLKLCTKCLRIAKKPKTEITEEIKVEAPIPATV